MFPITKQGHDRLIAELQELKTVKRRKIIEAISSAREMGDLSENAEYHAAKEEQAFNEGRIEQLESKLGEAEVIDPSLLPKNKIYFGSKVQIRNLDTEEKSTYQIVSEEETDIKAGCISNVSPLGRALIGKTKGEEIGVRTPRGLMEYLILKIM